MVQKQNVLQNTKKIMQKKQTISAPKKGMNKDAHPSQLQNIEYIHAENVNTEFEVGDGLNITTEPSNSLSISFPEGYKVIGFKKDTLNEKTYYFLTNPETKKSSIGYAIDLKKESYNEDIYTPCTDCEGENVITYSVAQEADHTYVEIVEDTCHSIGEGLNFDINYPIKFVELKNEKLTSTLYWNDYKNPPRYLIVSDVSYLKTIEIPCEEDVIIDCIVVDKLLQFPKHTSMRINPEILLTGGNLKHGTYEFYGVYCDMQGNELTDYCTPTNPISIFDESNIITTQQTTDAFTNYSIKLKIDNLDTTFKYYKIVCVENNSVTQTQSAFVADIIPTTNDTVVYSSSGSINDDGKIATGNSSIKTRVEPYELSLIRPQIEKAKGEVAIAGKKFMFGMKYKEEINLQPVVNLFGSLLRWQTSVAKEDLYKSAIATSKFKGYQRDEVYPFGIRFLYKEGGKSAVYPLIGRPSNDDDTVLLDNLDNNYKSINDLSDECTSTDRNKKWQYKNTAFSEDFCGTEENSIEIVQQQEKTCIIENVNTLPSNFLSLDNVGSYSTLKEWIEENINYVTNPTNVEAYNTIGIFLLTNYPQHCTPTFNVSCDTPANLIEEENYISLVSSKIEVGTPLIENEQYIVFTLDVSDDFTGTGFVSEGEPFYATGAQPTTWLLTEVEKIDETYSVYNELDIEEYGLTPRPKFCSPFKRDEENGKYITNAEIEDATCGLVILERDFSASNTTCYSAEEVQDNAPLTPSVGIFHDVLFNVNAENLLTNKKVLPSNISYQDILTFKNTTSGSAEVTINGVVYTTTANTPSAFNSVHGVAIATSTGGVISVSGDDFIITNATDGIISKVERLTGDLVIKVNSRSFTGSVHKNALYYKVNKNGRDKIVFEITPHTNCSNTKDNSQISDEVRYSIFETCSATTSIGGEIYDINDGVFKYLDISTYPDTFYIAIDTPLTVSSVKTEAYCEDSLSTEDYNIVGILRPPCGCFDIRVRDVEYSSISVTWDTMIIDKKETYTTSCTFLVPKVGDCDPQPYENGSFSYWESLEEYPDNDELYDSSALKIKEEDLVLLSASDKQKILDYFTVDGQIDANENYVLKSSTRFNCSGIRHFKMPDNIVAPFMTNEAVYGTTDAATSLIFPLGVSIDENVVVTVLDIAEKNNLITTQQRDSIEAFEIVRGDNSFSKSIVANGIGFDLYKYNKNKQEYYYSNYPFNTLGEDSMHYSSSSRTQYVKHPFDSDSNNKFTIISPDLLNKRPQIPSEVSLSGYQIGFSTTRFQEVEDHPKWTILGKKSKDLATRLAIAEVALETTIQLAELGSQVDSWFTAGMSSGTNAIGTVIQYIYFGTALASLLTNAFVKLGKYRYQWLETFRNLGAKSNFSSYSVGIGNYNSFIVNDKDNSLLRAIDVKKHLNKGRGRMRSSKTGEELFINNFLREDCTLITLGTHNFEYNNTYKEWDNYDNEQATASRTIASENDCKDDKDISKHVGSPYFTLKNYIPDQYGGIDTINWKTTNSIFKLGETTACKTIFGGNMFISRFSWKRKLPFFTATAMGIPDKTPYEYSKYNNIAYPRFYVDYEIDKDSDSLGGVIFPDIYSDTKFDCTTGATKMYYKKPSKFYLYSYGIVDFLVESEINCNFRQGRKEPQDNFYPNVGDVVEWTQQKNLSISEPNTLFYNSVYSSSVSNTSLKKLDALYSKENSYKKSIQDNSVMYSKEDGDETNLFLDPWLVYKPLDKYEFATKYGKLQRLQNLQSNQILGLFTDQVVVFNKVDSLADRITPLTSVTGTGGIFATRPTEFSITDLGFAGTQNTELTNTPYGNFYVDAKRGKIYQMRPDGNGIEPISEVINGKPSGMRNWFREHLPFKVLKQFPNIDTDNKFKGIGLNIWYDARFDRVFFTKKDIIVKKGILLENFEIVDGNLFYNDVEVGYDDTTLFEDVSFTIAFKPSEGWISFYSFKPNYSVAHQDYFTTGLNTEGTLWNHYLGNKSFQNFYNKQERMLVEYPVQAENIRKQLTTVAFNIEARRWQNEWDYSEHREVGFDKMVIYNNTNNSGLLNLVEQKNIRQVKDYPKTNNNLSQDILYTAEEGKHTINYFYNRVKNQDNNVQQWLWDKNMLNKELNPQAISFRGKNLLERLRGEYFIVRLINDTNSKFQIICKNSINTENGYS